MSDMIDTNAPDVAGRLLRFRIAEIVPSPMGAGWYLAVSGIEEAVGAEPVLVPRAYDSRPDYWAIDLVAQPCADGAGSAMATLMIDDTLGHYGICVFGRDQSVALAPPA